ncbi:MAG: sulfatase-like hydrolase/transferase [Pirellulales bacterium]
MNSSAVDERRERGPRWRWGAAAGLGLLLAGGCWAAIRFATSPSTPAGPRWNVVLITLDTTRADHLGCYGSRFDTPAIDALARDGVRFEQCYAPVPLTLPSHSSLLTGLVPPRHGVHDNGPQRLDERATTWPEILSRRGYETGAVVGAFVLDHQFGLQQGFAHYNDQMPADSGGRFNYAQRNAAQVTDEALAWLAQPHAAPVFLWVHYFDPHAPYDPPGYDPAFAMRPRYDAEIYYVDTQLRRLLAGIDAQAAGPTLVILTADHGEGLGQHGEDSHGLFAYNSTLRVPLIVRFPDGRLQRRVVRAPVALVDVLPSVLSWLGIDVPLGLDGQLLPLADPPSATPRTVYFENQFPTSAFGWASVDGIMHGGYKLIRAPQPELYDLAGDPQERDNLFQADNERSQQMMKQIESLTSDFAALPSLEEREAAVSQPELARLRALGYAGAARPPTSAHLAAQPLPDPKQMLPVYQQLQEIPVLIEQRQVGQATERLLDILEMRDPQNNRGLRMLAALPPEEPALRARALTCLERAVSHDVSPSSDPYVLGCYGRMLLADAQGAKAAEVFARLQRLEPTSAAACRFLAEAYRQAGDAAQAGRWQKRAGELALRKEPDPDWASEQITPK